MHATLSSSKAGVIFGSQSSGPVMKRTPWLNVFMNLSHDLALESAAPHKMLNVVLVCVIFILVAHFCFLNSELVDNTIEWPDELLDYTIEHNIP